MNNTEDEVIFVGGLFTEWLVLWRPRRLIPKGRGGRAINSEVGHGNVNTPTDFE